MSTLKNRTNPCLLVVDVQKDIVEGAPARDEVIANIARLVDKARAEGVEVIWVQHSDEEIVKGSEGWAYVEELERHDDEPLVHKTYLDSFEGTELEELLATRSVSTLYVVGAQSDACIRSTLHGGLTRGYDVTLVADAHTTQDLSEWGAPAPEAVVSHTNLYWSFTTAPGRETRVLRTDEVAFSA